MSKPDKIVEEGTTEVPYTIVEVHGLEGFEGAAYEWVLNSGDSSASYFDTVEEARQGVKTYFG